MKLVKAEVSYHALGNPPVNNDMEAHFLFDTVSGKSYLMQTTVDGIHYVDVGILTLPPNAKLNWTVNTKEGVWPQLVEHA